MEITRVFKACVKAAKTRNKVDTTSDILPRSKKKKSEEVSFNSKAIEVVGGITKFKTFLVDCQSDYLDEFSHLSFSSSMQDEERDQIDEDAQNFIKSCSTAIHKLKPSVNQSNLSKGEINHRLVVLELIESYHVGISKFYSQLKAYRVKQAIDVKRLSKLKPQRRKAANKTEESPEKTTQKPAKSTNKESLTSPSKKEDGGETDLLLIEEKKTSNREEFHFTAEETQIFEEENDALYNQMNSLVKEIRDIEGRVMEIGQLQEIFHEKVLSQSDQIDTIHNTAISTTENVNDGNEQIREAIKNSATFRVWVLFFLVMCTFSLLFLDWYNP